MDSEKLRKAKVCSLWMSQLLSKYNIYPCTYYSYVFFGQGDMSGFQLLKTQEAITLGFAHPAMTDWEAMSFLNSIQVTIDYVQRKKGFLAIHGPKFHFRYKQKILSESNTFCLAIIKLLDEKVIKGYDVINFMEQLKIRRFLKLEQQQKLDDEKEKE
jgi:hypothetical protein